MTEEKVPEKMSDEEWRIEFEERLNKIISRNRELFVKLGNRGKGGKK